MSVVEVLDSGFDVVEGEFGCGSMYKPPLGWSIADRSHADDGNMKWQMHFQTYMLDDAEVGIT